MAIFRSYVEYNNVLDTVSSVNYTGSLGFGEKFVQKLRGKCGMLDVQDCMASAQHLTEVGVSERGFGKQLVQGGSHGGFLTAHRRPLPFNRPGSLLENN